MFCIDAHLHMIVKHVGMDVNVKAGFLLKSIEHCRQRRPGRSTSSCARTWSKLANPAARRGDQRGAGERHCQMHRLPLE